MGRYLFTVWPFPGHVYPQLSIAIALRDRGNSVAFYTGAAMRETVAAEGFDVFPFVQIDEEELWPAIIQSEINSPRGWWTPKLWKLVLDRWLIGTIKGQVADLTRVLDEWQPDAIVTDETMWGPSLLLHETRPIPVALASPISCHIPGWDAPPAGPGLPSPRGAVYSVVSRLASAAFDRLGAGSRARVDGIRHEYGLRPMGCSMNAYTARLPLYLVMSLPELDFNRRDLPSSVRYVGACTWTRPSNQRPAQGLDQLDNRFPIVHVTEGTVHHQDPFVLRAALEGLANRPMQVVATTGPLRDPASLKLGPIAPNVRVEPWVSHKDLLPRCSVLVTTGGASSLMAALEAGVPLVIVPTHWDKADNAQRMVEAGVAVRLAPGRCTPDRLRAAVEQVLTTPGFHSKAHAISVRLAGSPGPSGAAQLIENLAQRPPASMAGAIHTSSRLSHQGGVQ